MLPLGFQDRLKHSRVQGLKVQDSSPHETEAPIHLLIHWLLLRCFPKWLSSLWLTCPTWKMGKPEIARQPCLCHLQFSSHTANISSPLPGTDVSTKLQKVVTSHGEQSGGVEKCSYVIIEAWV